MATRRQEEELVKYLERTAQEREEKAKAREQKQQKKLAKKAAALAQVSGPEGIVFPPRRSAEVAAKYRLPLALDHEVLEVRLYWVPLLQPDTTIARLPFGVPILKRYARARSPGVEGARAAVPAAVTKRACGGLSAGAALSTRDDLNTESEQFRNLIDYLSHETRPLAYREAAKQLGTDISNSTYSKFVAMCCRTSDFLDYSDVRRGAAAGGTRRCKPRTDALRPALAGARCLCASRRSFCSTRCCGCPTSCRTWRWISTA